MSTATSGELESPIGSVQAVWGNVKTVLRNSKSDYRTSRVSSVDAARGAAMLFVCLAHFSNGYHFIAGATELGAYLVAIGMIASPRSSRSAAS